MNRLMIYWLHFLRFWHVIDATCYQYSGNHMMLMDSRIAIARIDAEIDRLSLSV